MFLSGAYVWSECFAFFIKLLIFRTSVHKMTTVFDQMEIEIFQPRTEEEQM